ncbi:hypothetical protein QE435_000637 [Rhizobium sp. SORGH_AS 787]|nr:hypothetical protein [Rhizobium sp. SORGH_AS_0787]
MTGCIVNNYSPLTSVNFLAKQGSSTLAEIEGGRHGDLVSKTNALHAQGCPEALTVRCSRGTFLCKRRDVPFYIENSDASAHAEISVHRRMAALKYMVWIDG